MHLPREPKRPHLRRYADRIRRSVVTLSAAAAVFTVFGTTAAFAEEPAESESDGAKIGKFIFSNLEGQAKKGGEAALSKVGTMAADMVLSYYGLDGILGGQEDPFAAHVAKILNAIESAKDEVIDHIDSRWDSQTYADTSAAIKKLNQWQVLTLTERADQVSVAADLFDSFASVLGRYEADLINYRRLSLLHEYAAVADVTAGLGVEWIQLSVLNSATKDVRTALTAEWRREGVTRAATIEDALFALDATARSALDSRLRMATRDSIDAILLGSNFGPFPAAANLLQTVGLLSGPDLLRVVTGRLYTGEVTYPNGVWTYTTGYDLGLSESDGTVLSKTKFFGEQFSGNGGECDRTTYSAYGDWDGRQVNWAQSWMSPPCRTASDGLTMGFTYSVAYPSHAHELHVAVNLYAPLRFVLEKWWQAAGHGGLRPYNELDDLTDMYVMDFHAEQGGDAIEAFAHAVRDGGPLRVDRSYDDPLWNPRAVYYRSVVTRDTRLPAGAREDNRALVDLALRFGADGAVDFLSAVDELDHLRAEPTTLAETVRYARTGVKPAAYRAIQSGRFAAKFLAIL